MLQTLVVTLREGVEAALIIGIVLAYLNKTGRRESRIIVFAGLATAIIGSIAAAIGLAQFDLNQEIFEGVVMLVAAFFVVTMIIFMNRAAKTLKRSIETRVDTLASTGSKIGLFLFVFLMVLREGAETVLVLSAVRLSTSALMGFLGTLLGVALSVLFGVMFVQGSVKIDLGKFFRVTTVILYFVTAQMTIAGLHELSEAGVLPSSKRQMALIGPIVRNDVFFFVTILALAALMVLFESRKSIAPTAAEASKAEQRKAAWSARRERFWSSAVYVSCFVFILLVTAEFIYTKSVSALSPATAINFSNGEATIDATPMENGELRRYVADVFGKPVRFLVYKKPDGRVATVLDACAICGPVGFYNSGTQGMTCKNCNAPINPEAVGDGGGCNPVPLVTTVTGQTIKLTLLELEKSTTQVKE